jgi:hypothetical protein
MKKYLFLIFLFSCTVTKPTAWAKVLDGSRSFDLDGFIVSYKWRQLSGPKAIITNDRMVVTTVQITGPSAFELWGIDNQGAVGRDTIYLP